jgi:RNA polymerase sigma-70 factor (ECF subfamily)
MKNTKKFTPDDDAQLLSFWRQGDTSAYEKLLWKYEKTLFTLAQFLTDNQEDAGEAVAGAFAEAYQKIDTLRSTVRFSNWITGLTLARTRPLTAKQPAGPPLVNTGEEGGGGKPSPPLSARRAEDSGPGRFSQDPVQSKLFACLKSLPREFQEIVVLRHVQGYPVADISTIIKLREEVVSDRLSQAQDLLVKCLKSAMGYGEKVADPSPERSALAHANIRRKLAAYLDNQMNDRDKEEVKRHLGSCGSCREELAEQEWIIENLRSIATSHPPSWLSGRILAKLNELPAAVAKTVGSTGKERRAVLLFLATVLAVVAGAFALRLLAPGTKPVTPTAATTARNKAPLSPPATAPQTGTSSLGKLFSLYAPREKGESAATPEDHGEVNPLPSAPAAPPSLPVPPPPLQETVPAPKALPEGQAEPVAKKSRPGAELALPTDWGEDLPPSKALPRKAPAPRVRSSGEMEVLLSSADPVAAQQAIERAVIRLGGRINGRAHSGGSDILFSQIEVSSSYELINRLGKIGNLLELPHIPEGAEGPIDLAIKVQQK